MMTKASTETRRPGITLRAAVLGGLMLLAGPVAAQSGGHQMMVIDDGGGPQVVHFSGPDLRELRTPDFDRKDLPIFDERLALDDTQQLVVGVLLDAYLDAFRTLAKEVLPAAPPPMLGAAMGAPGEGADGETLESIVRDAIRASGGDADADLDLSMQGPVAIQIEATAAFGEEGEGAAAAGDAVEGETTEQEVQMVWPEGDVDAPPEGAESSVVIAVAGPDDLELPPELQEKLARKAQEMADRIREALEQAEAQGAEPDAAMDAAGEAEQRQAYFDQLRAATKKFRQAKAGLKQDFISDVQGQLSAEQLARWPSFERALTRFKTLPDGRLDGERVDLLRVVDEFELSEPQLRDLAETLEAYELGLHEALVARNKFLPEAQSKIDESIEEGKFAAALTAADQASRLRVAVRGVNEQYAEAIARQLGPGTGDVFRTQVLRKSYPLVYRTTRGQKAFAAARRFDGLDDEVRAAIDALYDAYAVELDAANERFRQTIHREQPRAPRAMIENVRAVMEGTADPELPGADDAIHEALAKRSDLDERYMKQLYSLLTPEQVEALPKLPSEVKAKPIVIKREAGGK